MVLGSFGFEIREADLRERCDCTPYGTGALLAIDAARKLGFVGTAKHTLTLDELRATVADGHHPIVFVDLSPIDGVDAIHSLVVVAVSQYELTVIDPLKGERLLSLQAFSTAWAMRHHLAIVVEQ